MTWQYNWIRTQRRADCQGVQWVPMVKSGSSPADVRSAVDDISAAGHDVVLGFNEPERAAQADLSVDRALELWPALTSNEDLTVVSPASSGQRGLQWSEEFLTRAQRQGLRVDVIATHWYGWAEGSCTAERFDRYLDRVEALPGDQPIWVTEVGCGGDSGDQARSFYNDMLEVLDDHPRVERYAWFAAAAGNGLTTGGGSPTPLGRDYADASGRR